MPPNYFISPKREAGKLKKIAQKKYRNREGAEERELPAPASASASGEGSAGGPELLLYPHPD